MPINWIHTVYRRQLCKLDIPWKNMYHSITYHIQQRYMLSQHQNANDNERETFNTQMSSWKVTNSQMKYLALSIRLSLQTAIER